MVTKKQRIVAWLVAHGYTLVNKTYAHYVAYVSPISQRTFFIGRNGAVRFSGTGNLSSATSQTAVIMRKVEQWEKSR